MRKTLVLIVLAVLTFIFCFGAGCNVIQDKLSEPDRVRVESDVLKWNSVSGARNYAVYVDGNEIAITTDTFYDLSNVNLQMGNHSIAVMAKGDSYLKLDSALSESIIYLVKDKENEPNTSGIDVEPVDDYKTVVLENENDFYEMAYDLGLGYGVDALNADSAINNPKTAFFDMKKFDKSSIGESKIGSSKSSSEVRSDISSELTAINSKMVYGVEANGSYAGMFTAGFSSKFSLETAASSELNVNQLYYMMNIYKIGKNYQIIDYRTYENFHDKLLPTTIAFIENIRKGKKTAEEFFVRYGTHMTMAVSYGQMVNVNYAYYSTETIKASKIKEGLDAKLTAGFSNGFASVSGGVSVEQGLNEDYYREDEDTWTSLYVVGIGGEGFYAMTFEELASKYPKWESQIENADNYTVVDVCDGGLVPIWNYIPDEYEDVIEILKNYFYKTATEKASELAGKMLSRSEDEIETESYKIVLEPKSCQDNNGYNTDKPATSDIAKNEIDPHVVDLYVLGCVKNENDTYTIANKQAFEIGFVFVQGTKIGDIGLTHYNGSTVDYARVDGDSYSDHVKDTGINEKIDYGAYYYQVIYKDGTSDTGTKACNFMKGKSKNDIQVLINNEYKFNEKKKVDKINITCVYEIEAHYTGGCGGNTYTNWRCDYTINFE